MKTTVSVHDFREAFHRMGRGSHFSYQGLGILFDWLEEWETSGGDELELDVVALCCDFAEDEPRGIAEQYGIDNRGMSDEETAEAVRCDLMAHGNFIGETDDGSIVYRQH
jgi:hypothetical protein